MNSQRIAMTIYIVLSLITIVILSVALSRKKNCNENFTKCICTGSDGGRGRVCQDTEQVQLAYRNGLTENSDWGKLQREAGGPSWTTVSPGDVDFPQSEGCPWK